MSAQDGARPAAPHDTQPAGHRRTALASVAAAMVLVALKLGTGIATGSLGLISAGIESSGDVVAAALTFLAVRLGGRPADEDHPYGHRRAENLAALGEAAILTGGGVFIVVAAVGQLVDGGEPLQTSWYVFAVIAFAICLDLSRIAVSLRGAARYDSAALRSNAFHFSADLAGSLAVLGGLALVAAGMRSGDAIAALVVACVIFGAAGRLVYENARVLMDTTPSEAYAQALAAAADAAPGGEVERLRVRESGGRYFADVVVAVPPAQPVLESHRTADAIEQAVQSALPHSDVVVHLEPGGRDLTLREQILAIALAPPAIREVHDIDVFEHEHGAIITLHLKFEGSVPLAHAHAVADEIEAQLQALDGVAEARTHLEPIEPQRRSARDADRQRDVEDRIRTVVAALTGEPPRDLRALRTRAGTVVLLTVTVAADLSLRDAHDVAEAMEAAIRSELTDVAEVVVHTEPATESDP
jgi:cation diffusion facilitator family transporter